MICMFLLGMVQQNVDSVGHRTWPGGSAAFDLPVIGPITGPAAGVAWKLYETSAQLSFLDPLQL